MLLISWNKIYLPQSIVVQLWKVFLYTFWRPWFIIAYQDCYCNCRKAFPILLHYLFIVTLFVYCYIICLLLHYLFIVTLFVYCYIICLLLHYLFVVTLFVYYYIICLLLHYLFIVTLFVYCYNICFIAIYSRYNLNTILNVNP